MEKTDNIPLNSSTHLYSKQVKTRKRKRANERTRQTLASTSHNLDQVANLSTPGTESIAPFVQRDVPTIAEIIDVARNRRRFSPGAEAMRLISSQPFGNDVIVSGVLRTPNPNVVFKHVEKIGCTTLKKVLIDHMYPGVLELPVDRYHHDAHATKFNWTHNVSYDVLRMEVNEHILEHCLWVTFCRNPYERLKSCYRDKVIGSRASEREYTNFIRREILFYQMRNGSYCREDYSHDGLASFSSFVKFVCSPDTFSDIHWRPQLAMNAADIVPNLRLVRFESFSKDLQDVFATELGVQWNAEARENTSENRLQENNSLQYDEALAALVYEKYRDDFEFFGYDRESWRSV
ncbi:sulfotransferase family 2 domain-containing protein [Paraburkholderia sp.]|jgi:hypothetical protein|uniref:sulfotransferase family 2 domain-containing protein n=1 Tax=Paraburkholderia sp. TaxID=1926495 RepID=UPI003C7AA8F1